VPNRSRGGRTAAARLVLTSREAPSELGVLSGGAVRSFQLGGLEVDEARVLLAPKQLVGTGEQWAELTARFGGRSMLDDVPRVARRDRNRVPQAIGLDDAPRLSASPVGGWGMSFFELDGLRENIGLTQPVRDDALLIALQLKTCPDFDLYADGRLIQPRAFNAGAVAIFDLRANLASDLRDSFHAIDLYLPVQALNAIADDMGAARVDELRLTTGTAVEDPTLQNLLLSMRPALAAPGGHTQVLFVDHVANAIATHVAHTYGGARPRQPYDTGGLAPFHERRAKELLSANLSGGILLSELAQACELSVRHFSRAFRQSTGMAPHEWLVHLRLDRAKGLLAGSSRPLAEVASECGFADQSHFTRSFLRDVGVTPREWRRVQHE